MKKLISYLILFFGFSYCTTSQGHLNFSDLRLSEGYIYMNNTSNYIDPGDTGKNISWNLSNLTPITETPNVITLFGFDSVFSNSNFAIISIINNDSTFRFFFEDSITRNELGSKSSSFLFKYNIPFANLKFPIQYLMTDTQLISATYINNNIETFRNGLSTIIYDGYGSVSTPFKTFNDVIRRTETVTYKDSQSSFEVNSTIVITTWWAKGYSLPVVTITSGVSSLGNQIYTASFLSEPTNSTKNYFINSDVTVHPNPVSYVLNINTDWLNYEVIFKNGIGQIVYKGYSDKIYVNNYEPGIYILSICNINTNEVRYKKIIIE